MDASKGSFAKAGDQIIQLNYTKVWSNICFDIRPQESKVVRVEFNHPNAVSEHARGVRINDFRRLGITIRKINVLSNQKQEKKIFKWKSLI